MSKQDASSEDEVLICLDCDEATDELCGECGSCLDCCGCEEGFLGEDGELDEDEDESDEDEDESDEDEE